MPVGFPQKLCVQALPPFRVTPALILCQLQTLSLDAYDFYTSYTDIDTFDLASAQALAISAAGPSAVKLAADAGRLDKIYLAQLQTSLLNDPKAFLSRLQASASPWPFSSTVMSQASGVLLGYESLVSRDLLNAKNVPSTTPGISIDVSPGAAATRATTPAADGTAGAAGFTTTSSKAVGIPAATGNPPLMIAVAAAAAGMLGIIALYEMNPNRRSILFERQATTYFYSYSPGYRMVSGMFTQGDVDFLNVYYIIIPTIYQVIMHFSLPNWFEHSATFH
jgi:hypothetical protein